MKNLLVLIAFVSVLFVSADLQAQIIPNYNPAPGPTQRVLTNAERNVVDAAIHWWHVSHPDVGPINIDFLFDTDVDPLAVTTGFTEDGSGRPISSLIRFSDQPGSFTWYVDPTPLVNEPGEVPINQWDLLSTTSHEIAHAIGFTRFYTPFAAQIGAPLPDDRRPYNCVGPPPAIATLVQEARGTHVDPGAHPGDLMVPALNDATRIIQSALDIAMLACPFQYAVNGPPVADAGPNQTVECTSPDGVDVTLDGTGSSDPDGNPLTYSWSATGIVFDDDTSPTPTAEFPIGATTVTLVVSDGVSDDDDTVVITVEDTTPPVITCPGDVTVECVDFCGTPKDDPQLIAFFDGVSATDLCCDDVDITNDAPDCFALGETTVTFTAEDCSGNQSTCTAKVTVVDTTPPELSVRLNRNILWPPNHKWVDIRAFVEVTDICCGTPTWRLVDVRSNEPANGKGDGNTDVDIEIITRRHVRLRSERAGGGDGRVYTFVFRARDCSDNRTTVLRRVRVPHDHSGFALASVGFSAEGIGFDSALDRFALVLPSTAEQFEVDEHGNEVQISEAFDATTIDLSEACVGNLKDVILPIETLEIDNNADGLMDLALYYSALDVNMLLVESTPTEDGQIDITNDYGAVGFHYTSVDGVDYLVPDIFNLGPPVPLVPTIVVRRSGELGGDERDGRGGETPGVTTLQPAYPNPFNPSTMIPFHLVGQERVVLRIYNARGELVRALKDEVMPVGLHQVLWDGLDNDGRQVATGVYFVSLHAGAYQATKKVVMIK